MSTVKLSRQGRAEKTKNGIQKKWGGGCFCRQDPLINSKKTRPRQPSNYNLRCGAQFNAKILIYRRIERYAAATVAPYRKKLSPARPPLNKYGGTYNSSSCAASY